jgi:para-nitrobenzyl esterase
MKAYKKFLIAWAAMVAALGGAFVLSAAAVPPARPVSAALVVATVDGRLRGHAEGEVVNFEGVPFAAPPVGPLRWHAPDPVKPWPGVRDARQFGPPCAQAALGWNDAVAAQSREDCLYLNVWVPQHREGAALPVMVFFHGGAYHGGSARGLSTIEPSYDGAKLARRGVIVVTANYRLGLFGFLAHPELSAESPRHASGNYALMDNIAALNWVKANIARFGGDPKNVTIFGQSAGAFSVGFLMTSPLAKGLFAKAIAHSGTVLAHNAIRPNLEQAEAAGAKFARGLGAPAQGAIAALRLRSAQDLLETMIADPKLHDVEPRDPVVDGFVLPEQPARVFEAGHEAPVPLIVGNTARDGDLDSMGVSGTPKADATLSDRSRPLSDTHHVAPITAKDAKTIAAYYTDYPNLAERAAKTYAGANAATPADGDAITAFDTDIYFRCAASLIAKWHARSAPTWRFEFSHGYEPLGAVHLWDMFYVFGWLKPPADQLRDAELVDQIERYWAQFARSGNPQAKDLPVWPKFGAQGAYMDFASAGAVRRNGLRTAACGLFAQKTVRDLAVRPARKTAR